MDLLRNKESGYFNTFTEDISSESKSYTLDEVKTMFNLKFNVLELIVKVLWKHCLMRTLSCMKS